MRRGRVRVANEGVERKQAREERQQIQTLYVPRDTIRSGDVQAPRHLTKMFDPNATD